MASRGCPIKHPSKCQTCPISPRERLERCSFYRGQVKSGVPWVKDRHRWLPSQQAQWKE